MQNITLSFDNGPDPEVTPFVLDVLARHDIKTTFFVMGDKLRDSERRKVCERARAEGHWIGNHTFNHLTPLGRIRYRNAHIVEIARTQELLGELAHPRKLFRPFGGGGHLDDSLLGQGSLDYLIENKFTCVLWNVVPRDWEDPEGWVDRAIEQCQHEKWPLMVLHDLSTDAMAALEDFIVRMKSEAIFIQDFPPQCVPIVKGEIVAAVEQYVSPPTPIVKSAARDLHDPTQG